MRVEQQMYTNIKDLDYLLHIYNYYKIGILV